MDIADFKQIVWDYYRHHQRRMPWRDNTDPYWILVSEIMLQQTQVDRVIPKFEAFIGRFPSITKLAEAPFADVLAAWSGLGYNRRAKYLHQAANQIIARHGGAVMNDQKQLEALPGVGVNTAAAIRAYAFNEPVVFVETNIRAAVLHHFFSNKKEVHDSDASRVVEQALETHNPREWYWALMDYGSYLKKQHPNPSRRSAHHVKQSKFQGSKRQLRGQVLRALMNGPQSLSQLQMQIQDERLDAVISELRGEAMIAQSGAVFKIAG